MKQLLSTATPGEGSVARPEPPCVSVIIVSFNTATLLCDCLASLDRAADTTLLEVIVVDNASADGSAETVREHFPDVHLIVNSSNLGFGAASNQGVAVAHGKYVLLLNSDTVVYPEAIERLVAEIEADPAVGIVGPCLIGADGKEQRSTFRFPTPGVLFLEQLSLAQHFPVVPGSLREGRARTSVSVDWLLGACMMGQRSLLRELGHLIHTFSCMLKISTSAIALISWAGTYDSFQAQL